MFFHTRALDNQHLLAIEGGKTNSEWAQYRHETLSMNETHGSSTVAVDRSLHIEGTSTTAPPNDFLHCLDHAPVVAPHRARQEPAPKTAPAAQRKSAASAPRQGCQRPWRCTATATTNGALHCLVHRHRSLHNTGRVSNHEQTCTAKMFCSAKRG